MVRFLVLLLIAFSSVAHSQDGGSCEVDFSPLPSDISSSLDLDGIRKISIDESKDDPSIVHVSFYINEENGTTTNNDRPVTFEFDLANLGHSNEVDNSDNLSSLEVSSSGSVLSNYGGHDRYKNYGISAGSLELIENSGTSHNTNDVQLLISSTEIVVSQGILYSVFGAGRVKLASAAIGRNFAANNIAISSGGVIKGALVKAGKNPIIAKGPGVGNVVKVATAVYLVLDGLARYGHVFNSDNTTSSPISAIGDFIMDITHDEDNY